MTRWLRARVAETRLRPEQLARSCSTFPAGRAHDAGQHVDVRLTAPDGYTAQRSYSIASADALGSARNHGPAVPGGEVSPYLVDTAQVGDEFELRGPVGGWFVDRHTRRPR